MYSLTKYLDLEGPLYILRGHRLEFQNYFAWLGISFYSPDWGTSEETILLSYQLLLFVYLVLHIFINKYSHSPIAHIVCNITLENSVLEQHSHRLQLPNLHR